MGHVDKEATKWMLNIPLLTTEPKHKKKEIQNNGGLCTPLKKTNTGGKIWNDHQEHGTKGGYKVTIEIILAIQLEDVI